MELNATQKKILEFLTDRQRSSLPVPSVREIGSRVGLRSPASVQNALDRLEELGYITRGKLLKRSITVNSVKNDFVYVPLVGTIAAGQPILAVEDVEAYLPYHSATSPDKEYFALRIKGESMRDAGILDGDIIFVEKRSFASNGDIVAALIEDEATVKTFYKENGHFRLQPENDDFDPIIVDEVTILGKVTGLYRDFD